MADDAVIKIEFTESAAQGAQPPAGAPPTPTQGTLADFMERERQRIPVPPKADLLAHVSDEEDRKRQELQRAANDAAEAAHERRLEQVEEEAKAQAAADAKRWREEQDRLDALPEMRKRLAARVAQLDVEEGKKQALQQAEVERRLGEEEAQRRRLALRAAQLDAQQPLDVLPGDDAGRRALRRQKEIDFAREQREMEKLRGGEQTLDVIDPETGRPAKDKPATGGTLPVLQQILAQQGGALGSLGGAAGKLGAMAGGDLAAAAGPAGLALAAGKQIYDAIDQTAVKGIESLGEKARSVASLDLRGLGESLVKDTASVIPFGDVLVSATHEVTAFTDALDATARRLSGFSPELAQAEAMRDVAQTLGDIRRAQTLGPDLARFVEAQTRAEQAGQDAMAHLLKPLIPLAEKLAESAEKVADSTATLEPLFAMLSVDWQAKLQVIQALFELQTGYLRMILGEVEKPNQEDAGDFIDAMFEAFGRGEPGNEVPAGPPVGGPR